MVDYLGLLDQDAVPHIAARDFTWWVTELHPDYWVTDRAPWGPNDAVLADPAFQSATSR